jgi:predicted SprT family Zn-dependent metalloprotease
MPNFSHERLQEAAQRVANVYAEIANKEMGCTLPIPVNLSFDLCHHKPKAAGDASTAMKVRINMILFEDNVEEILNDTIPHEIGHLAQFNKFNLKGVSISDHGAEWKEIMRRLGKIPRQFHKLDTSRAVQFKKDLKKVTDEA